MGSPFRSTAMIGGPWTLVALFSLLLHHAAGKLLFGDPAALHSANAVQGGYSWTEEWYEFMPIDHFDFTGDTKFQLRFLINLESYRSGGPIFFYTGNEGNIEGFANNTGFMWDLAPDYGAALVFAEHRFYGKTQPFGKESYKSVKNLGYLSSTQALADFATLVDWLRKERIPGAQHSAVVAFGGSYGGMLAAWFRIKYPHMCDGAIAASAPVFWFRNTKTPEDVYDRIVTRSFVNGGCDAKAVLQSWRSLRNLSNTATGRVFLNRIFKLSNESHIVSANDVDFLIAYIKEAMESMAMVNYPYPTEFLSPLPGWPVRVACRSFEKQKGSDEEYAKALYDVVNLYYNYTGTVKELCANPVTCSGAFAALGDPLGWPWQSCTEMVMPQCASSAPNDFFEKDCPFTVEKFIDYCTNTFNKSVGYNPEFMRPDWVITAFGDHFPGASNIVFSNGYLDPWSGGGWALKPKTHGTLVSLIIDDGAHHYDLRGAHPNDTAAVQEARRIERNHITAWIKKAQNTRKHKELQEAKNRRREEHRRRQKHFKFDF